MVLSWYHALHDCRPAGLCTIFTPSNRRLHIFDTLLRIFYWVISLAQNFQCFRDPFLSINIPYGSRHDRALLVLFKFN